jgi:hypothetical protein
VPLADLLNVPQTELDWRLWGFAHRDQHNIVRGAIQQQYGFNLPDYPLDPIDLDRVQDFLQWNQQAHDDVNGVLQTQASDLQFVDIKNKSQLEAWIYLHRREHETWSDKLKAS